MVTYVHRTPAPQGASHGPMALLTSCVISPVFAPWLQVAQRPSSHRPEAQDAHILVQRGQLQPQLLKSQKPGKWIPELTQHNSTYRQVAASSGGPGSGTEVAGGLSRHQSLSEAQPQALG